MLYEICCAVCALVFLLGAFAAVCILLWLLCRPKRGEISFAVVRLTAEEQNAAARVSFLLIATALLFGAKNTAVVAVLAPGAQRLRRELSAVFRGERRLFVCEEDDLAGTLRKKSEETAEKSR